MWSVKSLSRVRLFATPWTVAYQVPPSMGFFQPRILEWVAIFFSRRSSQPRDWTRVSCIVGRHFTVWATYPRLNVSDFTHPRFLILPSEIFSHWLPPLLTWWYKFCEDLEDHIFPLASLLVCEKKEKRWPIIIVLYIKQREKNGMVSFLLLPPYQATLKFSLEGKHMQSRLGCRNLVTEASRKMQRSRDTGLHNKTWRCFPNIHCTPSSSFSCCAFQDRLTLWEFPWWTLTGLREPR